MTVYARVESGTVYIFDIHTELDPTFRASLVTTTEPELDEDTDEVPIHHMPTAPPYFGPPSESGY